MFNVIINYVTMVFFWKRYQKDMMVSHYQALSYYFIFYLKNARYLWITYVKGRKYYINKLIFDNNNNIIHFQISFILLSFYEQLETYFYNNSFSLEILIWIHLIFNIIIYIGTDQYGEITRTKLLLYIDK